MFGCGFQKVEGTFLVPRGVTLPRGHVARKGGKWGARWGTLQRHARLINGLWSYHCATDVRYGREGERNGGESVPVESRLTARALSGHGVSLDVSRQC